MLSQRCNPFLSRGLSCGCAALALLSLAACGEQGSYYEGVDAVTYVELAPLAPPPPYEETKDGLTNPHTQVWRPGHWVYENSDFSWVPGEVLTRPAPTAVWSADRWERREYGWTFVHGYWQ